MSDLAESSCVAVIGMAGRWPGASTVEEFWDNLCRGIESVSRIPEQDEPGQPHYSAAYGVLERADEFDADFFQYSPAEALIIDPQQRVFLECAHEALERAGYAAPSGRATVGVFAGGGTTDYRAVVSSQLHHLPMVDEWQLRLATAPDFLATRVAHKLGLDGPAVAVQTACSTSLVAVHLAIQSLLAGECQIALAGGSNVHVPYPTIRYTEGGIVAADGHTRAFDMAADGCVGGSAAAVVVLKPLADARADGDHIHAILRGSAINNDGSDRIGFTAPSVAGQARAIRTAHLVAEVEADTITYVEAHGTGTRLGDPIEVAALARAFRAGTHRRGYCALGSVKTNVGHTDAAAGATGLIKTVLAVEHGLLPPSLHFQKPNPELHLDDSPFVIVKELQSWRPIGIPRRAGVSALGAGGTNAHVVVEQAPPAPVAGPARPQQLLVVSAQTSGALHTATDRLAAYLHDNPDLNLADAAWTLQVGRSAHRYRLALVAPDTAQAAAVLAHTTFADSAIGAAHNGGVAGPSLVFMFPGHGSQRVGMARELYVHEPRFRAVVDECAELAAPALGLDLRAVLYPDPGDTAAVQAASARLASAALGQPAVFVIEYALAALLRDWGLQPDAVVGHSLGAYAAACVSGVVDLPDAVRVVARRGELLQALPAGAMLAIQLPAQQAMPLLPDGVSIAAVNGPARCTVAGPAVRIATLAQDLRARGAEVRVLSIPTAGHSALVEPIVADFHDCVAALSLRKPTVPVLSDTTGEWADPCALTKPTYWATHLRSTVQFGRALSTLFSEPRNVLVEVGPGRTLVTLARQHPDSANRPLVQTLPHPLEETSELATALAAVGKLWTLGATVDWQGLHRGQRRRRVVLPTYPFQRKRYLVQHLEPVSSTATSAVDRDLSLAGPITVDRNGTDPGGNGIKRDAASGDAHPVELALRDMFAEALGLARLTFDDDFFDLGGDSVIATKLAAWVRRRFGVKFTAVDIIRSHTVAACSALVIRRVAEAGSGPSSSAALTGSQPSGNRTGA